MPNRDTSSQSLPKSRAPYLIQQLGDPAGKHPAPQKARTSRLVLRIITETSKRVSNKILKLKTALSQIADEEPEHGKRPQAAVAAIIRSNSRDLELLFIQRSHRQGDPWSGHLAFPGGRLEAIDPSPRAAAERETLEEIGLSLQRTDFLAPLKNLTGLRLPVSVSAFAYFVQETPEFTLSDEAQSAFWVPFSDLTNPCRQTSYVLKNPDQSETFDAIDLLGPDHPVLWGITYRFTQQLISALPRN